MQQLLLPGIVEKLTKGEMRTVIAHRLYGLELRQAARKVKRDRRNKRRKEAGRGAL